jgi:DNA repair exonuclease SbcCD ATPase subunit
MDQDRPEGNSQPQQDINPNTPWAGRIGEQKGRLVSYLSGSGKALPDAFKDLLDSWDHAKSLEGPQHKEMDGIRTHLNQVARLIEAVVIVSKDDVARLTQALADSKSQVQAAQAQAHELRQTLEGQLKEVRDQLAASDEERVKISQAHDEVVLEKNQLMKIATMAQETAEKFKEKAEAYDQLAADLQTAKTQKADAESRAHDLERDLQGTRDNLSSMTTERDHLKTRLERAEQDRDQNADRLSETQDKLEALKVEMQNALAKAAIEKDAAIVDARKKDLEDIEELRKKLLESESRVNQTKSNALDRERELAGELQSLRTERDDLLKKVDTAATNITKLQGEIAELKKTDKPGKA